MLRLVSVTSSGHEEFMRVAEEKQAVYAEGRRIYREAIPLIGRHEAETGEPPLFPELEPVQERVAPNAAPPVDE